MSTHENRGGSGGLSLIGFRLNSASPSESIFYILVSYNAENVVATTNGRIVFFDDARLAAKVLALSGSARGHAECVPVAPDFTCDPHAVIQAILEVDFDEDSRILDFINILTDMLSNIGAEIPIAWRTTVYDFADHLTFDPNYGKFFQGAEHGRGIVREALLWCIGAVLVNSTILRQEDPYWSAESG